MKKFKNEYLAFGMTSLFAESNKITISVGLFIVLSNMLSSIISEFREVSIIGNGVLGLTLIYLIFRWDSCAKKALDTLKESMEVDGE